LMRASRSTSPRTSRSNDGIALSLSPVSLILHQLNAPGAAIGSPAGI
jgi:hypothetical protein